MASFCVGVIYWNKGTVVAGARYERGWDGHLRPRVGERLDMAGHLRLSRGNTWPDTSACAAESAWRWPEPLTQFSSKQEETLWEHLTD